MYISSNTKSEEGNFEKIMDRAKKNREVADDRIDKDTETELRKAFDENQISENDLEMGLLELEESKKKRYFYHSFYFKKQIKPKQKHACSNKGYFFVFVALDLLLFAGSLCLSFFLKIRTNINFFLGIFINSILLISAAITFGIVSLYESLNFISIFKDFK